MGAAFVVAALVVAGAPAPEPAAPTPTPTAAPTPTSSEPPAVDLERGKNAFARAQYRRAIELLSPLVYPEVRLESEGEVVQTHRMLGVAHLYENDPDEARREFRKLLELRPDYRFDPLLDPPRVVDFFNLVVKDEEAELALIEGKRRRREQELEARRAREAERARAREALVLRYDHHSYAVNFVPFGAGQFQNGERRKGWAFLGAEAALGATSVAALVTNFALFGVAPQRRCTVTTPLDANGLPERCPTDKIDRTDENLSTNLLRTQVVSGGLFFAVAIWGVVDALHHYEPDVLVTPAPNGLAVTARF